MSKKKAAATTVLRISVETTAVLYLANRGSRSCCKRLCEKIEMLVEAIASLLCRRVLLRTPAVEAVAVSVEADMKVDVDVLRAIMKKASSINVQKANYHGFPHDCCSVQRPSKHLGKNPELGKKISHAMNHAMGAMNEQDKRDANFGYGQVVECAHADLNTLALLNGYDFRQLGHGRWNSNQTDDQVMIDLLKNAADKLGFKLTKKPVQKKVMTARAKTTVLGPQQLLSEQPQMAAALGIEVGTSAALYLIEQDAVGQATTVKDKPMDGLERST